MRNIAMRLRYAGTAYHGWQRQKSDPTVQGLVEDALSAILKCKTSVVGCGRTDAGVHAMKYCANFRTEAAIPADKLHLAMNARLPDDIAVCDAVEVEDSFHSVFSCEKKEYTYYIMNSNIRDPFLENRTWFFPAQLDLGVMREAAAAFCGTHDFSAVRSVGTNVKTTVRTVHYFDVERDGTQLQMRVCANGFLYNMARAMVGTLVFASLGKIKPEEIVSVLEKGDRSLAGPTAPACGLYMTGVWYGGKAGEMMLK